MRLTAEMLRTAGEAAKVWPKGRASYWGRPGRRWPRDTPWSLEVLDAVAAGKPGALG
jgi:hypothetical protein